MWICEIISRGNPAGNLALNHLRRAQDDFFLPSNWTVEKRNRYHTYDLCSISYPVGNYGPINEGSTAVLRASAVVC